MSNVWTDQYLTVDQISASWFTDLPRHDQVSACDMMNFSFYTYHTVRNAIKSCTDVSRRTKMRNKFDGCASAGGGLGVSDMNEALKHLDANGVRNWTDENSSKYWFTTGRPKLYVKAPVVTASFAVNFVQQVEKELGEYKSLSRDYLQLVEKLQSEQDKSVKDWDKIGTLLSKVKDNAERIEPFLWDVPRVQSYVKNAGSFADIVGKVHTAATRATKLQTLGLDDAEAWGLAAGATVIDALPILGSVYGAAIDWAIDFIPKWKQFMSDYHRRLDMASQGLDYTTVR